MSDPVHIEVKELKRGDLNMKVMINRAHGHMRVMDYRVGNYPEKREGLDQIAQQEGVRKAFTLVEKQDSQNWKVVGFFKEGVYPSFFRTADAYVMSRIYDEGGRPVDAAPAKPAPEEQIAFPGRKLRKPDGLRFELVGDARQRSSFFSGMDGQLRSLPFGRVEAPDLLLHARTRRQENWVAAEIDDSFGHATMGIAPPPADEDEMVLGAYACNELITTLGRREVANLFGLSPVGDRWSNELFAGLGFKVTGRLVQHLRVDGQQTTALIWHKRLSSAPS